MATPYCYSPETDNTEHRHHLILSIYVCLVRLLHLPLDTSMGLTWLLITSNLLSWAVFDKNIYSHHRINFGSQQSGSKLEVLNRFCMSHWKYEPSTFRRTDSESLPGKWKQIIDAHRHLQKGNLNCGCINLDLQMLHYLREEEPWLESFISQC